MVNWLEHTLVLDRDSFQEMVNGLHQDLSLGELDGLPLGLNGIDAVMLVDAAGQQFWFYAKKAEILDC